MQTVRSGGRFCLEVGGVAGPFMFHWKLGATHVHGSNETLKTNHRCSGSALSSVNSFLRNMFNHNVSHLAIHDLYDGLDWSPVTGLGAYHVRL